MAARYLAGRRTASVVLRAMTLRCELGIEPRFAFQTGTEDTHRNGKRPAPAERRKSAAQHAVGDEAPRDHMFANQRLVLAHELNEALATAWIRAARHLREIRQHDEPAIGSQLSQRAHRFAELVEKLVGCILGR